MINKVGYIEDISNACFIFLQNIYIIDLNYFQILKFRISINTFCVFHLLHYIFQKACSVIFRVTNVDK